MLQYPDIEKTVYTYEELRLLKEQYKSFYIYYDGIDDEKKAPPQGNTLNVHNSTVGFIAQDANTHDFDFRPNLYPNRQETVQPTTNDKRTFLSVGVKWIKNNMIEFIFSVAASLVAALIIWYFKLFR